MAWTADLDAEYGPPNGIHAMAATEPMLTTTPDRRLIINGAAAWVTAIRPKKLASTSCGCWSMGGLDQRTDGEVDTALLTRMSMRSLVWCVMSWKAFLIEAGSVTSS